MSTRERPADAGARDARRLLEVLRAELRDARTAADLSQRAVARGAGLSTSAYARLERGELALTSVEHLAKASRAVGRALSVRSFPADSPIRDAAQLRLETTAPSSAVD